MVNTKIGIVNTEIGKMNTRIGRGERGREVAATR
jgi:hypothetical protein